MKDLRKGYWGDIRVTFSGEGDFQGRREKNLERTAGYHCLHVAFHLLEQTCDPFGRIAHPGGGGVLTVELWK